VGTPAPRRQWLYGRPFDPLTGPTGRGFVERLLGGNVTCRMAKKPIPWPAPTVKLHLLLNWVEYIIM
jgi:hypothetical protein